jgi:hypothetical protein
MVNINKDKQNKEYLMQLVTLTINNEHVYKTIMFRQVNNAVVY